jgi:hypothetical protein
LPELWTIAPATFGTVMRSWTVRINFRLTESAILGDRQQRYRAATVICRK